MNEYTVTLKSVLRFRFEVIANSEEEAKRKALEEHNVENYVPVELHMIRARTDILDVEQWDSQEEE